MAMWLVPPHSNFRVPDHADRLLRTQDFDYEVMKKLKLVDAGPEGYAQYELTIGNEFSNLNDVMHGGAAGVIFGMLSQRPGS